VLLAEAEIAETANLSANGSPTSAMLPTVLIRASFDSGSGGWRTLTSVYALEREPKVSRADACTVCVPTIPTMKMLNSLLKLHELIASQDSLLMLPGVPTFHENWWDKGKLSSAQECDESWNTVEETCP